MLLFHDHAGDGMFLDLSAEPPVMFYDMLESPDSPIDIGLIKYFTFLAELWETPNIEFDPETNTVNFDSKSYDELHKALYKNN